jgi:hypothetical protein
MADIVTGTPAIVGFTNGMREDGLGLGLAAILLGQRLAADHADTINNINSTARDVQESVEINAKAGELATEKTGAANLLAVAGVQLEMAKIAGIAALAAATNTAAIQASIAECCCDVKALIIDKANATDALIRELNTASLAQALQDAKNELLAIKYRAAAAAAA